ncbi:MAG: hypothetical protein R3A79_28795 [Nannocystaceae bacterium]
MRLLTAAGVVALVALAVFGLGPRIAVAYVADAIASAATEDEELEALCRANRWVHRGLTPTYQVSCRDASGAEVRPWEDGRYDDVAALTLRWSSGREVERALLSARPLACVFGE